MRYRFWRSLPVRVGMLLLAATLIIGFLPLTFLVIVVAEWNAAVLVLLAVPAMLCKLYYYHVVETEATV